MRLIACLTALLLAAGQLLAFGIVTRTATRDTLSLPFQVLDSIGNAVDLAAGDSVYVTVFSPGGTVVYKDSMAYDDASLKSYDWEDFTGGEHYTYTEQVSVLDGASNSDGLYSYILVVDDNSSANLTTSFFGSFQIVNATLESSLDSAGAAAQSGAKALDSLGTIIDSLYAVLDSIQNQDDWVGNVRYAGADSVLELRGLHIIGTVANDTAIILEGNGDGPAMIIKGGNTANGIEIAGGPSGTFPTTGNGITIESSVGAGMYLSGYMDGAVFKASGNGGDGVTIAGGAFSGTSGYGLHIEGPGRGLGIIAGGTGTPAVYINAADGIAVEMSGLNDSDLVADVIGNLKGLATPADTNESGDTLARLNDSVYFQGAASSPSVIADAVWDETQTGHTTAGTFGKFLDTEVSGIGGGTGAYSRQILTMDTSANQVVPGVSLAVRNIDQSALIATGRTGSTGLASFNLDADSFLVVATAPGYLFIGFDTVVVSGAGTDTVAGHQFDPGEPGSADLCRVYGWVIDIQGNPEDNVTVSAGLPRGVVRSSGRLVSPRIVSGLTDSTGYFYLDLIPSDSLTGEDTDYEISISRPDGSILRRRVAVPASSDWQFVW